MSAPITLSHDQALDLAAALADAVVLAAGTAHFAEQIRWENLHDMLLHLIWPQMPWI